MWLQSRTAQPSKPAYAQQAFKSLETFNHDGIELARVSKRKRRQIPIRHFLFFVLAVMSFKVFLYFEIGQVAYTQKMESLAAGTQIEQAASWAMQMDPVSTWIINGIRFGAW